MDLSHVTSRKDIPNLLIQLKFKIICEVGVRNGDNFKTLLTSNPTEAVAVDLWTETSIRSQNDDCLSQGVLDEMYYNLVNFASKDKRITIIRDYSLNASKSFPDEYFDFVYLDADHTYAAVKADLEAWWRKVKKGGILAGHDYFKRFANGVTFGVIEAVDEFCDRNHIDKYIDKDYYPNFYLWKR